MINAISYVAPQTNSKADVDTAERRMQLVVSTCFVFPVMDFYPGLGKSSFWENPKFTKSHVW